MHGRSGIPTKGFNSVTACNNTHVVTHQLSRCTYRNISRHSIDVQCKFSQHLNRQEQELYTSLRNLAPSWMVRLCIYMYMNIYIHIRTHTPSMEVESRIACMCQTLIDCSQAIAHMQPPVTLAKASSQPAWRH